LARSWTDEAVHDRIYLTLRDTLICGRLPPGGAVSLRTLAADLGVSAMPVREAVRRLVAEGALTINAANKRLSVPDLTAPRVEQLSKLRLWIEPELAARAAARCTNEFGNHLNDLDHAVNQSIRTGDVESYMAANHAFHYSAADAAVLLQAAAGLWLQIGPFMRIVFGRVGTGSFVTDHHLEAILAFRNGDVLAARNAIDADIREGMSVLSEALVEVQAGAID